MNNRAMGVSVRSFKVMIPIGIGVLGNATGNALSAGNRPAIFSMKPGKHGQKAAPRKELVLQINGEARDRKTRGFVSVRPKRFRDERAENAVIWKKRPGLLLEVGKRELASTGQRIRGRRQTDK